MKFLKLHFLAYGCFTDVRLDFSEPGSGFHVIYGPNEAGKSTALRALTGLLYGIPAQTPDAFLHAMKDLRVAAELVRSDGQHGTFVRRKGNRDTLLNSEDKPVPDNLILEFLCGVTQQMFATIFRLDHNALRSGGDDLLAGKGDVAESLFQAGTGITGLRQALGAIDIEAEQFFKPRSSTAVINRAIDSYEDARKRSRDLAVAPRQWTEQSAALNEKVADLERRKARHLELSVQKERLERCRLALPHITRRKELMQALDALGPVKLLPESATRDREEAQRNQRDANRRKEEAEAKLAKLNTDLEQLRLPQELLAHADAISSVRERLDSYRQAARDLPTVRAEQNQFEADARTILSEVKPGLSLGEAETLRLTVVQRTRLRTLANEHHTLRERLRGASERAQSAQVQWKEKNRMLEQTTAPRDTGELERVLERAIKLGDLEGILNRETSELRLAQKQSAAELKRLPIWTGTLEQLETLPVPAVETVDQFETEFDRLSNEQKLLSSRREDDYQQQAKVEEGIRTLQLGGVVPTEQDLRRARERREQGWRLVRHAWLEDAADPEQEKAFDGDRPLADAYEKSVTGADSIADRLRREADRVAKLAELLADKEGRERRAAELESTQLALTMALEACQAQWREKWQGSNIVPLSPKEMRGWLSRHAALLAQAKDLQARRQSIAQLNDRIREHCAELCRALSTLAEPAKNEMESFAAQIQRGQAVLRDSKNAALKRANLENDVLRSARDHEKAEGEHEKAQKELDAWQNHWQQALAPLGLEAETQAEEVIAVLEELDTLFAKIEDAESRRLRVGKMEQHLALFDSDVHALAQSLEPDLRQLPADQAADRLQSLLVKAQQDDVRRQTLEKQVEQQRKSQDDAGRDSEQARRQLDDLMSRASSTELPALEEAEQKSAGLRQFKAQLDEVNRTLAGFTAGDTLDSFLTDTAALKADQLPFDIVELENEIRTLDELRSQLNQEIGVQRVQLNAIDGSDKAMIAAEEAQSALAIVRTGTERYMRLRLASEVLRRQIERYREQNQDPVIKRAGELFPRLTLDSFARIKTSFDEKDRPVLLGVRPSGEEVAVDGMSDGTRDQLFLALRLASLERQFSSGEPLPFIVDDVLIKFDDDRAMATLKILAEFCSKTQVLFFTHHARLIDLAQTAVPTAQLKIHRLRAH